MAKKETLNLDQQIDMMINRIDSYKKIRDYLKTLPGYDEYLTMTNPGNMPAVNEQCKMEFRYDIPYTLKDTKWSNGYQQIVPDDIIARSVLQHRTSIKFNVIHDAKKDILKFKITLIGDDSTFVDTVPCYNDSYAYPLDDFSVVGVLNKLFGRGVDATARTSVRRITDDKEFFKTIITTVIDVIKKDDIGQAEIAMHNLSMQKALTVLE